MEKKKKKEDEQKWNFNIWFSRLCLKVSGVFRVDLAIEQQSDHVQAAILNLPHP